VGARVGLELELLAPVGQTRDDVANAIAARARGRVLYGLKHAVEGELAPGKPKCRLSLACRVLDERGEWLCDVVDDTTIRAFVKGAPPAESSTGGRAASIVCDDTRFAKWLEKRSFGPSKELAERVRPLAEAFEATLVDGFPGQVIDPWGHVLAMAVEDDAKHERVVEIVTRPLTDERDAVLAELLESARECTVPEEGALHVHLDAEPWRDTAKLTRMIRGWNEERDQIIAQLKPNPNARKLGAFPERVERAAREIPPSTPWSVCAAALGLAGAVKACDVNLLGVIEKHPVQHTLEIRCLPMSLSAAEISRSVDDAIALLDELSAA
jgi:hypothetical protein